MVDVRLLGIAQDAGVPQVGCNCARCSNARAKDSARERAASLGLIDRSTNQYWMIDATPDFKDQFGYLMDEAPNCRFEGILLTHLHMGHYTGLIHLGEEAANFMSVPLYCTKTVWAFLQANAPWSRLIESGNLIHKEIAAGKEIALTTDLKVRPYMVPHRAHDGETLAFGVHGQGKHLFYCPDIDSWAAWGKDLESFLSGFDIALLDGSFYDEHELPGRNMAEIPHPTVLETMDLLGDLDREIVFIHLNHTNPLLSSEDVRDSAGRRGFQVGFEGQTWDL